MHIGRYRIHLNLNCMVIFDIPWMNTYGTCYHLKKDRKCFSFPSLFEHHDRIRKRYLGLSLLKNPTYWTSVVLKYIIIPQLSTRYITASKAYNVIPISQFSHIDHPYQLIFKLVWKSNGMCDAPDPCATN